MKPQKILLIFSLVLFSTILILAYGKGSEEPSQEPLAVERQAIDLTPSPVAEQPVKEEAPVAVEIPKASTPVETATAPTPPATPATTARPLPPEEDRVAELFTTYNSTLPIVKTISYNTKAEWLPGRTAWLVDYARHFKTSRYFLARSLAGHPDYFFERYSNGDAFNVYDEEKDFSFHMLLDSSNYKLWLYYVDHDTNEPTLIKTYNVGLGRKNEKAPSGSLTPYGTYSIGNKVAIYKPGMSGFFRHEKVEMIRIFGTRWLPFDKAIKNATLPAKGLGIHGTPWSVSEATQELTPTLEGIGSNESDGCIRLATEDVEELFAIITSRPAVIEIVESFYDSELFSSQE